MHIFRKGTKNMESNWIEKTESFLKGTFSESAWLSAHPEDRDYRLEHSYRVANIAKTIAEAEGFPAAYTVSVCAFGNMSALRCPSVFAQSIP